MSAASRLAGPRVLGEVGERQAKVIGRVTRERKTDVWIEISWPARRICCAISGREMTREPTTKKVACNFSLARYSSSRGVAGEGPSSKLMPQSTKRPRRTSAPLTRDMMTIPGVSTDGS